MDAALMLTLSVNGPLPFSAIYGTRDYFLVVVKCKENIQCRPRQVPLSSEYRILRFSETTVPIMLFFSDV